MLKKILPFILILCFAAPIFSEEVDWSKYDNVDNAWDGQKIITNKQFEETVNALEEKKNKKAKKMHEKAIRKFKGNSLHDNMEVHKDSIDSSTPLDTIEDCQLINIPIDFINNNKVIERGFYRVVGEKRQGNVYIRLFQSQKLITEIKAKETNDDFNEEFIQFVKLIPNNDYSMKLIFGCVEFNAYAYINAIDAQCYNN